MSARSLLPLILLMVGVTAVAVGVRLDAVADATVGSDAVGQYRAALQLIEQGAMPHPPNPEGGHSLWMLVLPLVPLAGSLEQLFALRFGLAAAIAPLGALAAWLLADGRGKLPAALAAGVVLALDVGLVDTLTSAFRGYGAPELLAVATLGGALAIRGRPWGLVMAAVALVGASGQHPFATGAAVGALLAMPGLIPGVSPRWRQIALACLVLAMVPRLHHLVWLAGCGDGAVDCLARVASGSAEPDTSRLEMLRRAANDRVLVEGWLPWPLLGIGVVGLALRPVCRRRPLLLWAVGAGVGVAAMGLLAASFRPYHLRLAMPGIAVAAAVGLSRWPSRWPVLPALLAVAAAVQWGPLRPFVVPSEIGPRDVDAVAKMILDETAGPVVVQSAWWDHPVGLDPTPVALSVWLQAADRDQRRPTADSPVVVLAHAPPPEALRALPPGARLIALPTARPSAALFGDAATAAAWLDRWEAPRVDRGGEWAGVVGRR